jgi:hypothetical protein
MKPVYQTKFGDKEGNCFAACLASLLEIEIDSVPDFYALYRSAWYLRFQDWLQQFGLVAVMFSDLPNDFPRNLYYLVGGESERGILHSCVAYNEEIVHDPHPSGTGLKRIDDYTFFIRTFVER